MARVANSKSLSMVSSCSKEEPAYPFAGSGTRRISICRYVVNNEETGNGKQETGSGKEKNRAPTPPAPARRAPAPPPPGGRTEEVDPLFPASRFLFPTRTGAGGGRWRCR